MVVQKPEWLCFDLDGTLVDSVPDITFSVNEMLQALQLNTVDEDITRTWVGNGTIKLLQRALHHVLEAEPSSHLLEQAKAHFFTAYKKNIAVKTVVYPGCLQVLEHFANKNIPLGCVTNKPRQFTSALLEKLGMAEFFRVLVCGDDLATQKPDPAPILEAIRQLNGQPQTGYMIGDSETDIMAANRAGTGAIYVSYGYNRGVCVEKHQPICVHSLKELLQLF